MILHRNSLKDFNQGRHCDPHGQEWHNRLDRQFDQQILKERDPRIFIRFQ